MQSLKRVFTRHGINERKLCKVFTVFRMSTLANLKFDNLVLRTLPIDKDTSNGSRTVPGACFSLVEPSPVENPEVVAYSPKALSLLGITEEDINNNDFKEYFSGNKLFIGSKTAAHCYCGHQFGYFSGQLGDGAAIYLGEVINSKNERWELQLKGAGLTPFSRTADGRKVLRSSIREFLCSEAMHSLGIPTTRAGTCVTSDTRVVRDIFYDGHPIMERCTIVSRIAPSFLRFGSFEIFKESDPQTGRQGPSVGKINILHTMLEYAITTLFPEIAPKLLEDRESCYLEFYKEVVRRTAKLVAMWQSVGFCHGVLNTDNMSILGITIDYGPYGFMDYFDPNYICNGSDREGRYTYVKQPEICKWNLLKFAEALKHALPLEKSKAALQEIYDTEFASHYYRIMHEKLGLKKIDFDINDEELIQKLLWTMQQTSADFTNTFCILADESILKADCSVILNKLLGICQDIEGVKKSFKGSINVNQVRALLQLAEVNPEIIEQLGMTIDQLKMILEKSEKEKEIMKLTQSQKSDQDRKYWNEWLDLFRERLQVDLKDCKDEDSTKMFLKERKQLMDQVNPRVILRNYMAQEAIQSAEEGEFTKVQELMKLLERPYDDINQDTITTTEKAYYCSAPLSAAELSVT